LDFVKDSSWTGGVLRFPLVFGNQSELSFDFKAFAGPKDYDVLRTEELGGLIDYGFFSFFAFPLLELLRFFYRFVHNYGLAIILLTLLVRILFYPLSLKGYRSMKAMQKLQPQIAALKEKYKDDTQRFGQEQMALFKTHKVNPAGGCLPMLVQLPVFIALYAVLDGLVELFHAPFYFWIKDLIGKRSVLCLPCLDGDFDVCSAKNDADTGHGYRHSKRSCC
jgi:YidC/Oxa1 family membrane protein insertase